MSHLAANTFRKRCSLSNPINIFSNCHFNSGRAFPYDQTGHASSEFDEPKVGGAVQVLFSPWLKSRLDPEFST